MSVTPDRRLVLAGGASLFLAPTAARTENALPAPIVKQIDALMQAHDVPAVGFGLVRGGKVAGVAGFGLRDRERGLKATADTAFLVSSISKVVTGTALMQLAERDLVKLDDPIAAHLDFAVENPRRPGPITFRQLLTHTSSISDANYEGFETDGDPTLSLRDFLVGYLTPGGRWYAPDKSYLDTAPGERWSYSNVASALVGYLCERIGGQSLKRQTARRIFQPLRMNPAAWTLADLQGAALAVPYVGEPGRLSPRAPLGYPDWPAGLLRASPRAMTRFLASYAGAGASGATRILRPATVRATIDLQAYPGREGRTKRQGLFWEPLGGAGAEIVAKGGSDPGSHSFIAFDPARGDGVVLLTNREPGRDLGTAMQQLIRNVLA